MGKNFEKRLILNKKTVADVKMSKKPFISVT